LVPAKGPDLVGYAGYLELVAGLKSSERNVRAGLGHGDSDSTILVGTTREQRDDSTRETGVAHRKITRRPGSTRAIIATWKIAFITELQSNCRTLKV
jgi:hypothetical protein